MLEYYSLPDKFDEVRSWYNGYIFGNSNVYNPWSVIMYLRDHIGANRDYFPMSYWANTSSNSIVRDLIERADSETKADIVKSNRESGNGRSGILVKPVHIFEKAFVLELKTAKQQGKKPVTLEMIDAAADEALKQIDEMRYADALLEDGYGNIGRYGIAFFKKDCRVHYKEGY